MARCRTVAPKVDRLFLVDVHRHEQKELQAKLALETDQEKRKALLVEMDACAERITQAQNDGDWIDVKHSLNAGETRHVFTNLVKTMTVGEKAILDPEKVGATKLLEYIIGWSLINADGSPMPFSGPALDSQEPETYSEISKAVELHEERVEQERAERKNALSTPTISEATSPLLSS